VNGKALAAGVPERQGDSRRFPLNPTLAVKTDDFHTTVSVKTVGQSMAEGVAKQLLSGE
jgi:hypothetical protein